jgi:hypothetical protein
VAKSVAVLVVTFLGQTSCGQACVVLMSDSVTALWRDAATGKELAGLRIANRGIPGKRNRAHAVAIPS